MTPVAAVDEGFDVNPDGSSNLRFGYPNGWAGVDMVQVWLDIMDLHGAEYMLTKTLAWSVVAITVACVAWWWWDPAGFSQNPVLRWFNSLSQHSPFSTH
jgi:hypothetical protein